MNGIVNEAGDAGSLYSSGLTSFAVVITVHHLMVIIGTRHFTALLAFVYLISFMMFMPLVVILNDIIPGSATYKSNFNDIIGGTPLFWLSTILVTSAVVLPIYAAKSYEMVFK